MRKNQFLSTILILILLLVCKNSFSAASARYTAKAIIRVLPYADRDPLLLETPKIDKDLQDRFRNSLVKLIQHQRSLMNLLNREKIRETLWFLSFNEDTATASLQAAAQDLEKNLKAFAEPNSDFIVISMTSGNKKDAAAIANEMAKAFFQQQAVEQEGEIRKRLTAFDEQKTSVQQELTVITKGLNNICLTSGFTDLEENNIPHPTRVRLDRLQAEVDNCTLEIKQIQTEIGILEKEWMRSVTAAQDVNNANNRLRIMQSRLEQLEKMHKEAKEQKKQFDLASSQYKELIIKKMEAFKRYSEINMAIEKLNIMLKDPSTPKIQIAAEATEMIKPD